MTRASASIESADATTQSWLVEVIQANETDFSRDGGAAKLSGRLRAAEAEESRGLSPELAVADEKFPHPLRSE